MAPKLWQSSQAGKLRIKPDHRGILSFLDDAKVRELVAKTADTIAERAAARAPGEWTVTHGNAPDDGLGHMRREDDPTPTRARSAILAQHYNAKRRAAGRLALRGAMRK